MYWSKYFIPTLKETPAGAEAVSHRLSLRAGMINMLTAGVYSYLPLGLRVLNRIETVIREEMNAAGAHEAFLPCLHPLDIWKQTGRDQTLSDVMIRFQDQKGREMCLGPTHEEIITDLVKNYVQSYRQLPVTLYQIQTKFRDEMRPRFGIVRACEFIMKDAYSFDRDQAGMEKNYRIMYEAYQRVFERCGLDYVIASADSGAMGGSVSHEFMVPSEIGEDAVLVCQECGFKTGVQGKLKEGDVCPECGAPDLKKVPALEVGHVFQLGTKYSEALGALFVDEDGQRRPVIMGCYGIGVSRMIAAVIESHHDDNGICWPLEVAPFAVEILPLQTDEETMSVADRLYSDLQDAGHDVLMDDRDESPGRKFKDADLIGIPYRIVIGKRSLKEGKVEVKRRTDRDAEQVPHPDAAKKIKEWIRHGC
ncbi:MAG: proline--tRNA ligase [Candidatus Omnitrophota bacterium]